MADWLTVPFALAAGLSGAVQTTSNVIEAGLAELLVIAIVLFLVGFLSGRRIA